MNDPRNEKSRPTVKCAECDGTGYVSELEPCYTCVGTGMREMNDDELETFKNNQKYGHHEKL